REEWTLSLFKTFKFTERSGFQFRAEAFNAFNHTQYNGINTGVFSTHGSTYTYSGTAGQVTSTFDPRVFQFGGKLFF
ncbi:MAG TPA: hypothetical protein VF730_05440, partial [Terracidiphilus sp.]